MKLLLLSLFTLLLPLLVPLSVFSTICYASKLESEEGLWKIEGVLSALNDSNEKVKIRAMGKIVDEVDLFRIHFKKIESDIVKLLKSSNVDVQEVAVWALGAMGESAKGYVPQIAELLKSSDSGVRQSAIEALGAMGESAKGYVPQIAELLKSSDSGVRQSAIEALGAMGESAKGYVPQIIELLKSSDSGVRWSAIGALGAMGESAKGYVPQIA
ncbi:MAG TPA: HEAT repeat domain-containing protein, partial [Candidatus Wunengus sp. YC65]|uniref:HEAT repeat domain-containing protein n=1 Tax=Candidatus Wunengus sp. YC65 TaxID=3367701 RepID=UPI004027FB0F